MLSNCNLPGFGLTLVASAGVRGNFRHICSLLLPRPLPYLHVMASASSGVSLDLSGKTALITGGSRGIGAATVRMFVRAGAKVAFSYEKAKADAEKLVAELGAENCIAIQTELSSAKSAEALVKAAIQRFGQLDALVANHGIWPSHDAAIDQMTEEQWRRTIAVNLDSVFGLIKHSVAQMKKQNFGSANPSGHIVIISSTAGQRGEAFHCDYAASKGAVISMRSEERRVGKGCRERW